MDAVTQTPFPPMPQTLALDTKIRFTDLLMGAQPDELEDFRLDRIARLRPALGGAVDDLEFETTQDSISVSYELTLAQAFELDFDPEAITERLITQAGLRGRGDDLIAMVSEAKDRYLTEAELATRRSGRSM